jgi:hypothetical protein
MRNLRIKGLILLCFAAVLSCKKESDNPQWNVDVLAPLVTSTLDISNLIADSLLQADSAGIMHVVFDNNLYKTNLDSLVNIPDTVLTTVFSIPATVAVGPGIVIYKDTTKFAFGTNGPQIRIAILRTGTLVMRAVNYSTADLDFIIRIPGAVSNSITFSQTGLLDAAAAAGDSLVKIFTYDLSGYHLDLTGTTGTDYNTLSYILEVKTNVASDTLHTIFNQPIFKVEETFSDIFPEYVKGKLGQDTISENSSTSLDLFRKIRSGVLNLQDATLTCTVENGIGVDAQLKINNITSVNSRTGNNVPLSAASLVGNNININRATETGNSSAPVNETFYTVTLNKTNSNLLSFIENLPDALSYSIHLTTNPLGPDISGGNDFVYADYLVNTKMHFEMPLAFSANVLTFVDTVDFVSNAEETFGNFRSGTLTLIADNGFPFQATLTLFLLDENLNAAASLTGNSIIAAAAVGADGHVNQRGKSYVDIPVSEAQMEHLKKTKKLILRASFTTTQYPRLLSIYEDYNIHFKLVADVTYMIH